MKSDLTAQPEPKAENSESSPGWEPFSKQSLPVAAGIAVLSILFAIPLSHHWRLAMGSDLYSHTILIPIVSLYLAWENRKQITGGSNKAWSWAILPFVLGVGLLALFFTKDLRPTNGDALEEYVAYSIGAYILFTISIVVSLNGKKAVWANLFPILFLLFFIPFTPDLKVAIQSFFQYTSAEVSYWFIAWSGIPIYREGLIFDMPAIDMEVAPQCSGIRSTLVLFITSLVGSYLFLKSKWKRGLIVFLVIPLGILRNGIRILVLAQLCHHIGPEQIDGWFHKQGGQPLFAVTLIPLFALLYWFWRSEKKQAAKTS